MLDEPIMIKILMRPPSKDNSGYIAASYLECGEHGEEPESDIQKPLRGGDLPDGKFNHHTVSAICAAVMNLYLTGDKFDGVDLVEVNAPEIEAVNTTVRPKLFIVKETDQ